MSASLKLLQAAAGVSTGFDPNTPIGTETNGGFFAGIMDTTTGNIIGADDYQTGARYALIVSPKDYEGGRGSSPAAGLTTGDLKWDADTRSGQSGSFTRWDGLASTNSILAKNDTDYEVFEFIRTLRTAYPVPSDGGSDWYVPAMDELELLYRNLKPATGNNSTFSSTRTFPGTQASGFNPSSDPTGSAYTGGNPSQTSVTAFQDSGAEAIDLDGYWSSTDTNEFLFSSGRVWFQFFTSSGQEGAQTSGNKDSAVHSLRPVRRILL